MRTSLPFLVALLLVTCAPWAVGQETWRATKPNRKGTVCYLNPSSAHTSIPAPESYRRLKAGARTKSANIVVDYEGFSIEARDAFQAAVDIWATIITTDVEIRIRASWSPLGQNVLGGASPGNYYKNFAGAPRANIWYPAPLAEKLARKNLNGTNPDIVASFNSTGINWHFGLDGFNPPAGRYDFMSVVLHEIGHGLGITNSYEANATSGLIGSGFSNNPVVFEVNLENSIGVNLITGFQSPSADLGTALRSGGLFFDSPLVRSVNSGEPARVFAPSPFDEGSSVAHLDEQSYPVGNPNSLMTPQIAAAERILDPGPIIMQVLKEEGWLTTFIIHEPLVGTENTVVPYDIVCEVTSDTSFDPETLTLNYSTNGTDFTTVAMDATGTPKQYKASIPTGSSTYQYFIELTDVDDRTISRPGLSYRQGEPITQSVITFVAGPDLKAPTINHVPVPFIVDFESLKIEAVITDNIGILNAKVIWDINGVTQPVQMLTLKDGTDSTYVKEIVFAADAISAGDMIHYRIVATDEAAAANTRSAPSATTFFEVAVEGLTDPQDFYYNDFNDLADEDFYGDGFSVITPAGFQNGAIHSLHPYPGGNGTPTDERNLFYNLSIPIRVADQDATIRFDEVVLVEPGEVGVPFGSPEFFDFVVVEGSVDGGLNWQPIADGWDARNKPEWLSHYQSQMVGQTSTAAGNAELYRTRHLNLLDKYEPGTIVALRFRLYSDPFATGWGWAIDNLGIQVDNIPPVIHHQHIDYLLEGTSQLEVNATVIDMTGLEQVVVESKINDGTVTTVNLDLNPEDDSYSHTLTFPALAAADELYYRIIAKDIFGNTTKIPATDFLEVAGVSLSSPTPVDQFDTGFASPTGDITGNYFSIGKEDGFLNGTIHSLHPYPVGAEPDGTTFSWILRKPIKVSATNPYITFDEVVITEHQGNQPVDFVVIEASKDGINWEKLIPEHAANFAPAWSTNFASGAAGTGGMFVRRMAEITASGTFKPDDVILIRCRFFSGLSTSGWGLAIDNLNVQGSVTASDVYGEQTTVYPNPVAGSEIFVRLSPGSNAQYSIQLMTSQGQTLRTDEQIASSDVIDHRMDISTLSKGLYLIRATTPKGTVVHKFVRE